MDKNNNKIVKDRESEKSKNIQSVLTTWHPVFVGVSDSYLVFPTLYVYMCEWFFPPIICFQFLPVKKLTSSTTLE